MRNAQLMQDWKLFIVAFVAKVLRDLTHTLPVGAGGKCLGAELAYPTESSAFPRETFFICETGSKNYAIMLSLGARTKKAMGDANSTFMKWMNVPQMVKDVSIHDGK